MADVIDCIEFYTYEFVLPDGRILQMKADRPFPFLETNWQGVMLDAQVLPRSLHYRG